MRIIQAIVALSSTFSIKSLFVTPVTPTRSPVGLKTTMARKRGSTGTTKPKTAEARVPTVGLEDVVFEFGTNGTRLARRVRSRRRGAAVAVLIEMLPRQAQQDTISVHTITTAAAAGRR